MQRYDLTGYLFGVSDAVDLVWVGYTWTNGKIVGARVRSYSHPINMYQYIKDGYIYLKFGPVSRYCNSFELSYQGHNGDIKSGLDIDGYKLTITANGNNLA